MKKIRNSSLTDIRLFNFLVHYGFENRSNLAQLLDEALIDVLSDCPKVSTNGLLFPRDVRLLKNGEKRLITGLLYKSATLKWDTIPDKDEEPLTDPGDKNVLPFARFVLSLNDHKLFWLTKRGLTKSPSPADFCQYVKKTCLPRLIDKYRLLAEIEWSGDSNTLKELGFKTKSRYISSFLQEHNLTRKSFNVRYVPVVSHEKLSILIDQSNYIVTSFKLHPHMNNVTDDDCVNLFTVADRIAREGDSNATVTFKPSDPKVGINKKTVKEILGINESLQLLKFALSLKDIFQRAKKPLVISNTNDDETTIAKTAVISVDPRSEGCLEKLAEAMPEISTPADLIEEDIVRRLDDRLD